MKDNYPPDRAAAEQVIAAFPGAAALRATLDLTKPIAVSAGIPGRRRRPADGPGGQRVRRDRPHGVALLTGATRGIGPGVRINAITPAVVKTVFAGPLYAGDEEEFSRMSRASFAVHKSPGCPGES